MTYFENIVSNINTSKKRLKNTILLIGLIALLLIGIIDYLTGTEMSFSIFYLIPISLAALHTSISYYRVFILSVFASFVWFFVEKYTVEYSHFVFPVWNAIVRFILFTSIGLLIVFLKIKQRSLNDANVKLQKLNEEKNRFIGMAAHDLRNPIGSIYSFSDLLISDYALEMSSDLRKIVEIIKNSSEFSLHIIKNLLDVSKIESGVIDLNISKKDFKSFIKEQIAIMQILADKKNINISFQCDYNEIYTDFDENYLCEVIQNLLSNAIKYSKKNTDVIVSINLLQDTIRTSVKDEGIGIAKEEQDKLFNYFQKTSSTPTDGESSTGLGLAIAKRIITLHQGNIGLESTQNKGSVFYFELPFTSK